MILFSSVLAVLLASVGFAVYEGHVFRASAQRELTALADSLGANSAASLAFNDQGTAQEMLAALKAEPYVLAACLYDNHRQIFAEYQRPGLSPQRLEQRARPDGLVEAGQQLTLSHGVYLHGERVGAISLIYDLSEFRSRLLEYAKLAILVLLLAVVTSFFPSMRLTRFIVDPLVQLAAVAHRITSDDDYSVRADIRGGGECGLLISSFNTMLARIESHQRALEHALWSLRESEERYALAARGANDGLWDWNLITNEIYFSPRWNHMLGYSEAEHWSSPEEWFCRIHADDRERVRGEIAEHCEGRTAEFVSEYRMHHKAGGYIWTLSRGIAVRDANAKAVRIAGSQTDITEGKIADPLTQLPNRLYFLDRLSSALDHAHDKGSQLAVLFIDLDKFKLVNDSLGHAAGDEILLAVARRLRACVRSGTRRGSEGQSVAARIGGDEFAVLLCDIHGPADADAVASRILERLVEPIHFESHRITVSGSIGIALNASVDNPEELLRNADTAMYYAKTGGKNRVEFFNEEMRDRVVARFEIEGGLRRAIGAGQLELHYQPIVSLVEMRILGFEALVRWNHPERGLIPPGEFISIAEESDLVSLVGQWVLKEACLQAADWNRTVARDNPIEISVNLSARQMRDPRLLQDVQAAIAASGIDPHCLTLELTESAMMGETDQTLITLEQLKSLHCNLHIDDFGTGYSSLSYLQRLPFDTLKIDRSFIRDLAAGTGSADIVKAIIELARSLRMSVIAEGVETAAEAARLWELGCKQIQGFLVSKPVDCYAAEALYVESLEGELLWDRIGELTSIRVAHVQPIDSVPASRRKLLGH